MNGQTIEIYLPQGDPSGIRLANLTTRTVNLFEVPRTLVSTFIKMSEAPQVAVYYLFGESEDGTPRCYIGQTGDIRVRLPQHSDKEFWTRALIATSLTGRWTSTHVGFLEKLSIDRAQEVARYPLTNGNNAVRPYTPAPLEAECYEFFETIDVLLTTLGYPLLSLAASTNSPGASPLASQNVEFILTDAGCQGRGRQIPEGFVVLAGSRGRTSLRPAAPGNIALKRSALAGDGIIKIDEQEIIFLKDHEFSSPTAAAQILVGGSINGRTAWRSSTGKTLRDLEEEDLSSASPSGAE